MGIYEDIMAYRPCCEQEERDREVMLDYIRRNDDAFLRTNLVAHMTASGWVVNPARDKVLMAYHKIYDSWPCGRRVRSAVRRAAGMPRGDRCQKCASGVAGYILARGADGRRA